MKPKSAFRKTKIVCTIGPATGSPEKVMELIEAGMDVARLNFSHGDHESHRRMIRLIRELSGRVGREIGILQDLGGPKIRIGEMKIGKLALHHGQRAVFFPGASSGDETIPVNYENFARDVEVGNTILLADGTVQLRVVEKKGDRIICVVDVGGVIVSHKGVNLPSSSLSVQALTEKDRADLEVGLEEKVDFVALSFIRSVADLSAVIERIRSIPFRPMLIAKIEKPQAVQSFEEILKAVDGVMIARGDLGVEMPLEEVPVIQKRIIRMSRQAGKPVITATQMLTSMMDNPRPTRAETTDAANAILDGADALMLSDETAVGNYPREAVEMLGRIARTTEPYLDESGFLNEGLSEFLHTVPAAISRAACGLALDIGASAIVGMSSSGYTARMISRYRPSEPVIALTDHRETQRQLSLSWGVVPHLVSAFIDTDQMFAQSRAWAIESGLAKSGDRLVITAGVPVGVPGTTNLLKVMEI